MFNQTEKAERIYLDKVLKQINLQLTGIEEEILSYSDNLLNTKKRAWENAGNMDKVEIAALRISSVEDSMFGELAIKQRDKLKKLYLSPYFGRIDYATLIVDGYKNDNTDLLPYYIGVHSFVDEKTKTDIVIDWRAPISSVFYDYESGDAEYLAPEGLIEGTLSLKRQYSIKHSTMEYMIESSMNIDDDILRQELSKTSDDKMKNIVATIQKEQNSIIRDNTTKVLIIQGSAGSGKTSIALHRVAFLLYRNRNTLKSDDVLILSPNRVFGSYISNVLPELGEENIPQIGFEDIAKKVLGRSVKFQGFFEQVADLISCPDPKTIERIRHKATPEFVSALEEFLQYAEEQFFYAEDFSVEGFRLSANEITSEFKRFKHMPIKKRLEKIASDRIAAYHRTHDYPLTVSGKRIIKEKIVKMFHVKDSVSLYKKFFEIEANYGMYNEHTHGVYEFCDVFPLCYVKLRFEGATHRYNEINHLLIDEMQDYTPIQYAVIAKLFSCRMTILGDSHQSVNPYTSSSMESISPFFKGVTKVELQKSYRSTIEITNFSLKILPNDRIIPIERHGEEPSVVEYSDAKAEFAAICKLIDDFSATNFNTLGIITKSQQEADAIYEKLAQRYKNISLLDFKSLEFSEGIIVTSCHMSKGLEFDCVIIPGCTRDNYQTELDRSLLYIACTRAMHRLNITYSWDSNGKSLFI